MVKTHNRIIAGVLSTLMVGQVLGNQIIGGVSSVIKDNYTSKRDGKKFGAYEAMQSAGNGILCGTDAGLLDGSGSASRHTSGHFGRLVSKLGNSKSDAVKGISSFFKGNSSVAKECLKKAGKTASNGIKYYLSQTTKDSIKTATSFGNIKSLIKSTAPSWKDSVATLFKGKS